VLTLIHYDEPRRFTGEELAFLQSLADQASVALQKARLLEASEKALFRTNQINLNLRRAFVPDLPLQASGLDIGSIFEPAMREIRLGGDFYDLFQLKPQRYGLVIGDVAGHDLDAAIQTAAAKYLLRAFAEHSRNTGKVIERLNQALLNQFQTPSFISLFYGIIDLKAGTLSYTNAGHEPPQLLLPHDGARRIVTLDETDPLLAIREDFQYLEHQVEFPLGAGLVLYTDGLTEARRGEDFLLTEGIRDILLRCPDDTSQLLATSLWTEVNHFADRIQDDVAILTVRRVEG
jgi:serine phosphatase RsbU (regulator of sigma subunit)